jgi:hypothetical protein
MCVKTLFLLISAPFKSLKDSSASTLFAKFSHAHAGAISPPVVPCSFDLHRKLNSPFLSPTNGEIPGFPPGSFFSNNLWLSLQGVQ